ncbi:hypothetical protein NBM05_03785 [Rothia sp. AR01]|uniref:Restriction endonuclease n=1 Tax=Rothia santali TaxID=2949643 RepID=A0A9X2KHU7_9MICC|nr:hypothetical protein [Rothia santali]MCP3425169.1 hypothetical protein [Rothia santali]
MKEKSQKVRPDWQRLEQNDFDQLVEALLHRVHADAKKVWSPEDSGGDGGRDVLVEYEAKTIIYQLKCYKDGLTSKPDSRKRQIAKSFKSALKHNPDEWVLVFPSKIHESMSKFLTLLPQHREVKDLSAAASVKIRYIDRPRLDVLISKHPDILNLLERNDDYTMRAAQVYGQERAILAGGLADLVSRVEGLGEIADSTDLHWGVSFWHDGKRTLVSPVPKHPHAGQVSPISQDFTLRIPASASELIAQTEGVFGFGDRGTLRVPGEYVELGKYQGPGFFKLQGEVGELIISAGKGDEDLLGKPVRLVILDEDGDVLADDEGTVSYSAPGNAGYTLEMSLSGRVTVKMRAPFAEGQSVDITMSQRASGARPAEVRDGATIICAISQAATLEVHLEGHKIHVLGSPQQQVNQDHLTHADELRSAADDLAVIQQHLRQTFPMPAVIEPIERLWLRTLRIALEGGVAPTPRRTLKVNLQASTDTNDLSSEEGDMVLWFSEKGTTTHLAGRDLRLPRLIFVHPRAMSEIDVEAKTAMVTPAGEEVFVVYAPDYLQDTSGQVTPWGLSQGEEPPVPTLRFASGQNG